MAASITEIKGTGDLRLSLRGEPIVEVRKFRFDADSDSAEFPTPEEAWTSALWDRVPNRLGLGNSSVRLGSDHPSKPFVIVQDVDGIYVDESKFIFEFFIIYGFITGGGFYPRNVPRRRWSVGVRHVDVQTGLNIVDWNRGVGTPLMRPEPLGWPYFAKVDGKEFPDPPTVDTDAILWKSVMVPEVTSDMFIPANSSGVFGPLPPNIGFFISMITKVNSSSFQGASPGEAQYLGFTIEEVGQPGQFDYRHSFRYGRNRVTVNEKSEPLTFYLDEDWFWLWELENRGSDPNGNLLPGRKPFSLVRVKLYERDDLNEILK